MRKELLMCLAAVLLTAGVASAVVWNPVANPDPNTRPFWHVAANWSTGILPDVQGTATFNVENQVECLVTGSQSVPTKLAMGDGGAVNGTWLRIKNGGTLTLGAPNTWHAVGYDRQATLTIEKGGKVTSPVRVMVGRNGATAGKPSYLNVIGGTMELTGGNLEMSRTTGWGQLLVDNDGLVDLKTGYITNDNNKMLINVRFGTIISNGNRVGNYDTWKNSVPTAQLVAFEGKGTLVYDYNVTNPGKTTLTAIHPMTPSPAYASTVFEGLVALSWKNMDPNFPGQPVYVDVWFGTDPNKLNPLYTKVVTTGMNTTTVNVNAPVVGTSPTTYYWQVDSYIYGSPTGTPIYGDVFKFKVSNDFPPTVVINTPVMATWPNQPVPMDATVTDLGASHSPVTITWTSNPAGAVFSPNANVEDPAVAMNPAGPFPATYTLTCSVKDTANPTVTNTATRNVVVYETACTAARRPNAPVPTSDTDADCDTDLVDLVKLLEDWTTNYTILGPTVIP